MQTASRSLVIAAMVSLLASPMAHAQRVAADAYPSRPIRMLIPYTPGGPTDVVGRLLAQRLQEVLGQQFVIDNRAGGSGAIVTEIVARMHAELVKILGAAEIARAFDALGVEPAPSTPAELEAYMRSETDRWRKVIATAGIRLE